MKKNMSISFVGDVLKEAIQKLTPQMKGYNLSNEALNKIEEKINEKSENTDDVVSQEKKNDFVSAYLDNYNAIRNEEIYQDEEYMAETTAEAKQELTNMLTKAFKELDSDDKYNTMSSYDKYLYRRIGKLYEEESEYIADAQAKTGKIDEDSVFADVLHEMQNSNAYGDMHERIGYLVANKLTDGDMDKALEQLVQGKTAYEYAKKEGIELTDMQIQDVYDGSIATEDIPAKLEEFRQENAEHQKNDIKKDVQNGTISAYRPKDGEQRNPVIVKNVTVSAYRPEDYEQQENNAENDFEYV